MPTRESAQAARWIPACAGMTIEGMVFFGAFSVAVIMLLVLILIIAFPELSVGILG